MDIISAATLLFLVMDPLGNIPVFLSVLDKVAPDSDRTPDGHAADRHLSTDVAGGNFRLHGRVVVIDHFGGALVGTCGKNAHDPVS